MSRGELVFIYGTMGSAKTATALMVAYNFRQNGHEALLAKPASDTRTEKMWSRIGIESDCITLEELTTMPMGKFKSYSVILIDEVQFATEAQVDRLAEIADEIGVKIYCYGLRTDFTGHLFDGSKRLMEIANSIRSIESICWCGEEAMFNARIDEHGNVIREGEQVVTGLAQYVPLCRRHFMNGVTGDVKHVEGTRDEQ